jgi:serine phosphatase RsbU (regulator of sigma subunit)
MILLSMIPLEEVYEDRDINILETAYADILLISSLYILISFLVEQLVVNNLAKINESLNKITHGNLNEVVNVRTSVEFASLSDDINETVAALKGYISAAKKKMEEELEFAYTIQDSALPKNFHFPRNDFEIYAMMDPAKEIGGDFYDFFFIDQNKLVLVIADVSGKGIPAALFMMRSKTTIRGLAEEGKSPSEILEKANNTLCEGNDAEMFVTVWIGIIDLETGLMQCANAGHEYPTIKKAGADFELFKDKHSLPLAAMPDTRIKEYELQMKPGDRLFVYTDGVPEAINEQTEEYGNDRMLNALNRDKDKPMEEILPNVRQDISDFVGEEEQFDDITMLGFTYRG